MNENQSKALTLADALEKWERSLMSQFGDCISSTEDSLLKSAAKELRRLHEVEKSLLTLEN